MLYTTKHNAYQKNEEI